MCESRYGSGTIPRLTFSLRLFKLSSSLSEFQRTMLPSNIEFLESFWVLLGDVKSAAAGTFKGSIQGDMSGSIQGVKTIVADPVFLGHPDPDP